MLHRPVSNLQPFDGEDLDWSQVHAFAFGLYRRGLQRQSGDHRVLLPAQGSEDGLHGEGRKLPLP